MITLCVHCLKPISKLQATILPARPGSPTPPTREPRSFVVDVQKLKTTFTEEAGRAEMVLSVITDDGVIPDDVRAADQYSCIECGGVLDMQIYCYTIKGMEISPAPTESLDDGEREAMAGYVMVATMGASSRFAMRSQQEIRDAVVGLVEFDDSHRVRAMGDPYGNFEWDS